jgi:hypothetical protein
MTCVLYYGYLLVLVVANMLAVAGVDHIIVSATDLLSLIKTY